MGEDSDLKSAHEAFHKAVQRGRDTVQNATLNTVERIRLDTATAIVRLEKGVDVAAEDVKKIARLSIGKHARVEMNGGARRSNVYCSRGERTNIELVVQSRPDRASARHFCQAPCRHW